MHAFGALLDVHGRLPDGRLRILSHIPDELALHAVRLVEQFARLRPHPAELPIDAHLREGLRMRWGLARKGRATEMWATGPESSLWPTSWAACESHPQQKATSASGPCTRSSAPPNGRPCA